MRGSGFGGQGSITRIVRQVAADDEAAGLHNVYDGIPLGIGQFW
jgi:hypothetical protein